VPRLLTGRFCPPCRPDTGPNAGLCVALDPEQDIGAALGQEQEIQDEKADTCWIDAPRDGSPRRRPWPPGWMRWAGGRRCAMVSAALPGAARGRRWSPGGRTFGPTAPWGRGKSWRHEPAGQAPSPNGLRSVPGGPKGQSISAGSWSFPRPIGVMAVKEFTRRLGQPSCPTLRAGIPAVLAAGGCRRCRNWTRSSPVRCRTGSACPRRRQQPEQADPRGVRRHHRRPFGQAVKDQRHYGPVPARLDTSSAAWA
jgi:hypothetical protein